VFHHALCVTDDRPAVGASLAAISPAVFRAMLGDDAAGVVEVVPLPAELNGRLVPGTTSISFAVDDLDERVAACRAAGLAVTVVPGDLPYAVVTVAGLEFELVSFGL
jgi:hypothetical protein